MRKASQEDRVFALLKSCGAGWTPAPELSRIALQYCRAINALRRRGISIENRLVIRDGLRCGFYRLAQPTQVLANLKTGSITPIGVIDKTKDLGHKLDSYSRGSVARAADPSQGSLFGALAPEGCYPD